MTQAEFSNLHISQKAKFLLNGTMHAKEIRRANLETLIKASESGSALAEKVGTNAAYISQLRSKNNKRGIGDKLARRLEEAMGKPSGWMDHQHSRDNKVPAQRTGEHVVLQLRVKHGGKEMHLAEPFKRLGKLTELWPYLTDETQADLLNQVENAVRDSRFGSQPPDPEFKQSKKKGKVSA